jgi:putative molybdopterin biosynthesis protein
MPTGLAVVRGKPVVSLPGFPVSAMLAFRTFVRPLLAKLVGAPEPPEPTIRAILKEKITGISGHRTFVRVRVSRMKDEYVATPLKAQRSSLLTSMVDANGIVNVPESASIIEAGTEVSVTLTGDLQT